MTLKLLAVWIGRRRGRRRRRGGEEGEEGEEEEEDVKWVTIVQERKRLFEWNPKV